MTETPDLDPFAALLSEVGESLGAYAFDSVEWCTVDDWCAAVGDAPTGERGRVARLTRRDMPGQVVLVRPRGDADDAGRPPRRFELAISYVTDAGARRVWRLDGAGRGMLTSTIGWTFLRRRGVRSAADGEGATGDASDASNGG